MCDTFGCIKDGNGNLMFAPSFIEISMAQNRQEDLPFLEELQKAGFEISADFMWLITVHTKEDVAKVKEIFDKYPSNKNKNFITH